MTSARSYLVTGANQGLGMHTVHQIASTPDAVVFMGSRKLAAAEEAIATFASSVHSSSAVVPVQLDITDDASIKAAHAFIAKELSARNLKGLDVLINNAGTNSPSFRETYEVNVFGTVAVTEAMRPLINNGGAIINISSRVGSMGSLLKIDSLPFAPPYSSSKSALNNLTVNWALQEKRKGSGIRVVSITPGLVVTKLSEHSGTVQPEDGCQIIVKTALEKEGRTAVFFSKEEDLEW
ncbi:hypothetical protein C8R44DRAFT_771783 [Mycena epipterygia]|nr:hypothetical protein C8R44DRAFT_771783 [Mycena epipterygia]